MTKTGLPELDNTVDKLKANLNLILGVAAVLILAWVATAFVQRQMQASREEPWEKALAVFPWNQTPEERVKVIEEIESSEVGALVLAHEAFQQLEESNWNGAREVLNQLKNDFPEHYLNTRRLPSPSNPTDASLKAPVVDRCLRTVEHQTKWGAEYPVPTANPKPSPKNYIILKTERGDLRINLYPERSPESCEALAQTAAQLEGTYVVKALADRWVELGVAADGTAIELEAVEGDFPPYESNDLYHFAGTVNFRQRPFSQGPYYGDLKISLGDNHREDGVSTVLGTVTEGLDLLREIASDPKADERPYQLAAPVQITKVEIVIPAVAEEVEETDD